MQVHLQPPRQAYMPLVIPQDKPVYRLKGQCYIDDELYESGAIIIFDDVPNIEMEPMNELANTNFRNFIDELDKLGRAAAEKAGRAYKNLADSFIVATELAEQKGRRVEMLNASKEVPIMGAKIKKRGARVDAETIPTVNTSSKLSLNTHAAANAPFTPDINPFTGKARNGKEKEVD